jgi:lysophospholipase L1-like esterase
VRLPQLTLPCFLRLPFLVLLYRGDAENQRRDLTGRVRQYVAEQNASGNQGLALVDMESAFDYYKLSEQRRKELFDDGIHLTQAGYNLMGDLVYQALERAMAV